MKKIGLAAAFLIVGMFAGTDAFASSQTTQKAYLLRTVAPVASSILLRSYRYIERLKRFSIEAEMSSDDMYLDRMVVTYTHRVEIDVWRPGKLFVSIDGDVKSREYYLSHGDFTVYDIPTRYYGKLRVSPNIDDALDYLFEAYGIKAVLANIIYSDLEKRIPPRNKGYYFGESEVDGKVCHHIGFDYPSHSYQVWIEKGAHPLIRKFLIVDKTNPLLLRSGATLKWDIDPKFPDGFFLFTPTKGDRHIDITPKQGVES